MSDWNKVPPQSGEGGPPYLIRFLVLVLAILIFLFSNVSLGSVVFPWKAIWGALTHADGTSEVVSEIVWEFRLPRALTACLAGAALAVSGLVMQTVFRNPLADPFVLGVSSGASLGVAIVLLALAPAGIALTESLHFSGHILVVLAAACGSGIVLTVLLIFAQRVDVMSLLILGLMISYGVGALVSLLLFYTMAERLQSFFNWSLGNFGNVTWSQLKVFVPLTLLGIATLLPMLKALDAFLLGERYAKSLGVNVKVARVALLGSASLLAGVVTGFCGPIGFLGVAAPHFARFIFKTSEHRVLVPGSILIGGMVASAADLISKAPWSEAMLPLNAVTALIGAPVIVVALLRQKNLRKAFGG